MVVLHQHLNNFYRIIAEKVYYLDGEFAATGCAFMSDTGQFQCAVLLGPEALPLIFKDVYQLVRETNLLSSHVPKRIGLSKKAAMVTIVAILTQSDKVRKRFLTEILISFVVHVYRTLSADTKIAVTI